MIDVLNLALPYFGLIFLGFACGRYQAAFPTSGLAWMDFFIVYRGAAGAVLSHPGEDPIRATQQRPLHH